MDGMWHFPSDTDILRNLVLQSLAGSTYEYRSGSGKAATETNRLEHHETLGQIPIAAANSGDRALDIYLSMIS